MKKKIIPESVKQHIGEELRKSNKFRKAYIKETTRLKRKCKFGCNCPIKLGFEAYFQGEDDEKKARKKLLPLIRKLLKIGNALLPYIKKKHRQ